MSILDIMKNRYSVRSFSDNPIEQEKLEIILKAGQCAPTAKNNQPQKILVINEKESLLQWQKCTVCHFNEQLVLLVCNDKNLSWKREYDGQDSGYVDCSIVATHMMLQAEELGIGSTWIMYFNPDAVKEEFKLPDNLEPVAVLVMGYAAENAAPSPRHTSRKNLSETVQYNHF